MCAEAGERARQRLAQERGHHVPKQRADFPKPLRRDPGHQCGGGSNKVCTGSAGSILWPHTATRGDAMRRCKALPGKRAAKHRPVAACGVRVIPHCGYLNYRMKPLLCSVLDPMSR